MASKRAAGEAPVEDIADGRVRRGAKNREDIIEAVLALVTEGVLAPTAEQIAQRAGVGTRTVFRHFDDMEQLHRELSVRALREARPLIEGPFEGSLEERLRELVRRRAALFERIAPMRRTGELHRPFSKVLQNDRTQTNRFLRAQLREAFGDALDAREQLIEEVDAVTSYEFWSRLREEQSLGRERAREIMHVLAARVLGLERPDPSD